MSARSGSGREIRISEDGWSSYNIWQHSATVADLYRNRARGEGEEMTCAAQAAELLAEYALPGETLLDAGCGSGYFYHSLRRRGIELEYYGIDATASFIDLGRIELAKVGLPADRLRTLRIEDFRGKADHVLCMNVLSNLDNFHRPLERLLDAAQKSLVLRESIKDGATYSYVRDMFLDAGVALNVYVNAYDRTELIDFVGRRGFSARVITDRRAGTEPEMVIGYPHYWTFLVAARQ